MHDYDFEPKAGKSIFLRLKDKDQKIVVRLASKPYREPKVWKEGVTAPMKDEQVTGLSEAQWVRIMSDPDYNVTEVFHWIVIDREDGNAKIFTSTAGVYKSIKEYAQKEQWGDPTRYDIEITRTEQPGRGYYSVSPYPDKDDLSNDDMQLVEAIDITDKIPNARALTDRQLDDTSEYQETYKKSNEEKKTSVSQASESPEKNKVGSSGYDKAKATRDALANKKAAEDMEIDIEDINAPIDLDDIPF